LSNLPVTIIGIQSRHYVPLMIRVCHLAKYYAPFRGGIETHVQAIARAQNASGLDVTVACINHLDDRNQDVWCDRLARTSRQSATDGGVRLEKFGKFGTLARFDFCTGLLGFLRNAPANFDILHLHVPNPTFSIAVAASKPSLPLVVTYHSDIVKQRFIRQPFRIVEKIVFNRVSQFIAATAAYANSSEVLRSRLNQTTVIPFGLNLDPYTNPSPSALRFRDQLLQRSGGLPLWLCVGRFVYYKGFEHAIRALPQCRGRLILVGSGELKTSLVSLAVELGVADRIEWLEKLSDDELVGAYHAATAFWFPSIVRSEAFGLVQIEAMASGCPVINTRIPGSGVAEVSLDNVSGITVAPASANELAAAANRLDTQPELLARLSKGAAQRASEHFSIQQMVEQTNDVYRSVLGLSAEASTASSAAPIG